MKSAIIVDDNEANCHLLKSILESGDWSIETASSGKDALDLAHQHPPDLIVSDILMPGMDGYQLCQKWKSDKALAGIPFVFCSATYTDEEDEAFARDLGADGFVCQPVEPDDLLAQIETIVGQIEDGRPVRRPSPDKDHHELNSDYSGILARKLDHKITEYRQTIEELESSRANLDYRVRELTCLHTINCLARDESLSFNTLCREAANELAAVLSDNRQAAVRVRFAGRDFESPGFKEFPSFATFPICHPSPQNCIQVYALEDLIRDNESYFEDRRMLVETVGNLLCGEFRRRDYAAREETAAHRSARLLQLTNRTGTESLSESDLIHDYLEAAVELTRSEIGYLHFVNDDQESIELAAWSASVLRQCEAIEEKHYPVSAAGIWADCVRQRAPVVHNDYATADHKKGLPNGHMPLHRHLSMPVIEGDKVRMILGVGNRTEPYDDSEIETMRIVAETLWSVIAKQRSTAQLQTTGDRLRLLEAAVNAASHAIVITGADGTIEWVNPAFTEITGYEAEEAIGTNPRILKSGRQTPEFYQGLWDSITAGKVWKGQLINKRKDGTLYDEEATITPVKDDTGAITHYIAIKENVTEQHELEQRFLRSQRMESIGLLAGGVAHDLNNVLAPILMSVDLLKETLDEKEKNEIISTLANNCERGANIIRQVLTFARGVEGQRVLVQMRHLAKEMVRIARDTFPKNISINLDIPSNLWTVSGDPTQLHQVILNLCVNARDAVLSGGSITISAENETLSRPLSYLNYEIQPGRWVHLRVKDNGCGMKPETLERVFEPFFTTKDQGKGTGLGLPTILGIVKSHRGLITVDSAPGQGTIFHVYLPASEEGQDAFAGELKPSSSPPRGDGQTILVVDDETPVLEVTKHILNQYNYQVLLASDGAEAVALYARQPDKIALVVTDIMMPIMDGVALVRALHKINPEVKIIGSSGFVGDDSSGNRMEELKSLGVDTVLEKPFTSRDLLTTIATELNDQT